MVEVGSVGMVELTVLVDNSIPLPRNRYLAAEYGLSILIHAVGEEETCILFDTGSTGKVLSENIDVLGFNIRDIDYVVLSHRHYDHTGGLKKLLELVGGIPVLAHPNLFEPALTDTPKLRSIGIPESREQIMALGCSLIPVRSPVSIASGIMLTGEIPRSWGPSSTSRFYRVVDGRIVDDDIVDESSLIVNVEGKGLVIVVGCCHAGIENIVNYSKEIANIKNIYGIVGGLHLLRSSTDRVDDVVSFISGQNVKALMPMHCTGVTAEAKLKERLPNIYHVGGVGARLRV
jgi:7,8-dihydropterin-6-yl-methyl-4-(beta-D-ribofuranosyl)aminobenzene 5'-phosphate synthase